MSIQNYSNHKKFYAAHHFIYLPLLALLLVGGIYKVFDDPQNQLVWILFSILIFLIIYLTLMVRQHYALGNQNRIVKLEFQQRYYELYQQRSEDVVKKLDFSQIAALRFAPDDEFKILLEQALSKNSSGDEIKKAITNWRPDTDRV